MLNENEKKELMNKMAIAAGGEVYYLADAEGANVTGSIISMARVICAGFGYSIGKPEYAEMKARIREEYNAIVAAQ